MLSAAPIILTGLICVSVVEMDNRFTDRFIWKIIDYEFPSNEERKAALESGYYKPGNSFITSIDIWGEFIFLATPRIKPGVPSTLNYISTKDLNKSPILKPYPSWEVNGLMNNKSPKVQKMISVYSIRADVCHRLWALDTGITDEFQSKRIEGPPTIYVYGLFDKALIRKHSINDEYFDGDSKFRNLVIDVTSGNCDNAYAYIADTKYGLIVYSWEVNKSHKIESNYFSFEPLWGNFKTSTGLMYQMNDGIQGMALSMPKRDGYRELFFQPLAGILEYRLPTDVLKNKTLLKECFRYTSLLGNRGNHMQSSASLLDLETGVLFYTTIVKNGIACWNSFSGDGMEPENQGLINEFNEPMSYPADIRLDNNSTLWVLTNKLIDFLFQKETPITFHIYTGYIPYLIKDTSCKLI